MHRGRLKAQARLDTTGSLQIIVPPFVQRERLDGFLARHGEPRERSRAEWQRLIEAGAVLVNGRESKASLRVAPGDVVRVVAPPKHLALQPDPGVPFEVVYTDPAMIVVDKPAGVVVHPAPGNETGTLVNGLLARFPELRDAAGDQRPGIVHRLDKDTSGLLVVGRTTAATAYLQRQMARRATEKRYLLLVAGNVSEDEGYIDAPIARDVRNRQRMSVRAGGREAHTKFFVRERFGDYTLVEALLLTGRTHQLRVHFSQIGRPIAGDPTYGRARPIPNLRRQFLHAHVLTIRSPHDEEDHTFVSELPQDLAAHLDRLRKRGPRPA